MKSLFLLAFLCFSSLSFAAVDSKKIEAVANKLSELLPMQEIKLKPASPLELLKQMADVVEYDDFYYNPEESLEGDSGAWGLIKMSQAIGWVKGAELLILDPETGDEREDSPEAREAAKLVRSLVGSGVVFGASPTGAVQCGFTFPSLLFIDTAEGVIYSFETEGSGC